MPSRRQIREAVIQFLYCADIEGGAEASSLRDAFWQFVTESDRRALVLATWKLIQHLSLGREERYAEMVERLPNARAVLRARPELESSAAALDRIFELEEAWSAQFSALAKIRRDDEDDTVSEKFGAGFDKLFSIDRDLRFARSEFLRVLDDHPGLRPQLEPVAGPINRLDRISERLQMIQHPEDFPDQAEFSKIRESRASLTELREKSDRIADAVLAEKPQIDERLNAVVENFAPERIDPIDRAILRLGTWEILSNPDVPTPVAINEAIELAKKFGTTDSGRFVNGILDKIAKS
ncbi:antitermination factor nusB, nutilization substance protein B [Haloferula helveola]|uniref:Antitermination factor nusB, nutilization substance protein B n=1 Tax=Haloferula helveola TaxID=490095 RepID=A0ABM7RBX5_9BACT|nr:antitermination factor nusB, nutilization substance protein B [Haloferula helveola]